MRALGVTIEAQFKVAEYDIVILSAKDSGGLDKWLRKNDYNIPKGANAVLRPYVEQDTKFFVAKVDSKKVKFRRRQGGLVPAALSLRRADVHASGAARVAQQLRASRT